MKPPLYVDLDGTLIRADTMQRASLLLLRDHPLHAIRAAFAMRHGRQVAKEIVADKVQLDPASLPYREAVIDYIRSAKAEGRRVVLATGSHRSYADAVAKHLNLFDAVFATENGVNLIGSDKLSTIRTDCGEAAFEYLGDSHADIVIFNASAVAGVIGGRAYEPGGQTRMHRLAHIHNNGFWDLLRLIRPHQWVKNLLVFLPLLASHQVSNTPLLLLSIAVFFVFSMIASGNYVLNDLFDAESDSRHPTKRNRPIASGAVTVPAALAIAIGLLVIGLGVSAIIGLGFLGVMVGYLILTNLYSFQLKRRLLVDVIALAAMYTLRPIAGGVATGIVPSPWLLAFCMFFFSCIAFAKRYTEVRQQIAMTPDQPVPGRGYQTADLDILRVVGPVNGYIAVLVVALYINSDAVLKTDLYTKPYILWLLCPILGYWITRIWFLAHRGVLHDDPVVFALTDWKSHLAVALCLLVAFAASM